MRQNSLVISIVAAAVVSFLGAGVASADFGIAGNWYSNRGPTVNIPPGQFDDGCGPASPGSPAIPFGGAAGMTPAPVPASQWVAAPCVRHQAPSFMANPTVTVPAKAFAFSPQSGVPAPAQQITGVPSTAGVTGQSIRIPASVFALNGFSQIPVPANPVVQQLDTTFTFQGPAPLKAPTSLSQGNQNPGIASQTRLMQPNAWSGAGQTSRLASNFVQQRTDTALGVTRRVAYTTGANKFGGTMGMMLKGVGNVYVIADLVPPNPGNELLISPIGDAANPFITVHMGKGYNTTQKRQGTYAPVYLNYGIPTPCTNTFPPEPLGCGLITGISGYAFGLPPGTTVNTGFPWTTGHVSAYGKGLIVGVPQTTTLTAVGSDTVSGGVRTIQLVSGGFALRNNPATGLGRTPHIEIATIQLPEPGSTMALMGALGLIGGLFGVRRKLF